jgi:urease accessory protein
MTLFEVPSYFEKYGNHQGASGRASIHLACSDSSKTAIDRLETKAPLLVQRALYPDGGLPKMAYVYLMSSSGGVLQGDRLEVEIEVDENAMARITTQSATKIYRMDKGYALQKVKIKAAGGSYVEFMPRQLIPYRSSRYCQEVTIMASPSSTVLYCETISAGRVASGERFDFDVCFLRMRAYGSDGHLNFSDVCSLEPGIDRKGTFERLFGSKMIWSTIYIITPPSSRDMMQKEILEAIEQSSLLAGCTTLPNDSGLLVRILDDSIDRVEELISAVAGITRNLVVGAKEKC